jgi:hypothetical protein
MLSKKDWKDIIYRKGKINATQVFKELADYSFLMEQASKVYEHFTGLSKTTYWATTIISEIENKNFDKRITQDDLKAIIKETIGRAELVKELKSYFEID